MNNISLNNINQQLNQTGLGYTTPLTPYNTYGESADLLPSGSTYSDYISGYTTTFEVTTESQIAGEGYNVGNDNNINAKNFINAGHNNNISGLNNLIVGSNNTINNIENGTIIGSNNTITNTAYDSVIIGTSPSGITITQRNTTTLAGLNIQSTRPIKPIIHIINGKPSNVPNRIKNIHVVNGARTSGSHTLGNEGDVIHVVNGVGENFL